MDSSFCIQKVTYESSTGKLKKPVPVYKCLSKRTESEGVYNSNIVFVSEKFAVLSDGVGSLQIFDTGDRQRDCEWKSLQTLSALNGTGFILQDAKLVIQKEEKFIHVLILNIAQSEEKFCNNVTWITLKHEKAKNAWEEVARRRIEGKGNLHYLALDPKCEGIKRFPEER